MSTRVLASALWTYAGTAQGAAPDRGGMVNAKARGGKFAQQGRGFNNKPTGANVTPLGATSRMAAVGEEGDLVPAMRELASGDGRDKKRKLDDVNSKVCLAILLLAL